MSLLDLPASLSNVYSQDAAGKVPAHQAFPVSQCTYDTSHTSFFECADSEWADYFRGEGSHPCDGNNKCCRFWTNLVNYKLGPIMKVMRMATGRGQSHFNFSEFLEPFNHLEIFKNLDLKRKESQLDDFFIDKTSFIPICTFNDNSKETDHNCSLFEPRVTNQGICYSFNADSPKETLQNSEFTKAFYDAYGTELHDKKIIKAKGKNRYSV